MNSSALNSEYTFEKFVVGDSNRAAHGYAIWFSNQYMNIPYNCQLLIYGNTGLGKTHLLQSTVYYIKNENPTAVILYLTGEDFSNDVISNIRAGNSADYTEKYISADALLIDDCEYLAGKTACQESLAFILKARTVGRNITVLSAAEKPDEISGLSSDLAIQMKNGVIADIQSPDLFLRRAILEQVLSEMEYTAPDVVDYIALNFKTNIQTMKNVLRQAVLASNLNKTPLTLETAQKAAVHFASEQALSRNIDATVTKELNNILFPQSTLKTGFIDYDHLTGGLHQNELILIAARPGMGKTSFILNIAEHLALWEKIPVVFFSLELSDTQVINKMIAQRSHVELSELRAQNLYSNDSPNRQKIIEAATCIGSSDLIVDDTPGITLEELCDKCRDYKREYNIKAIFIDYLQLLLPLDKNKEAACCAVLKSLKLLAKGLSLPVIITSQICRAIENRRDHHPLLKDLKKTVPCAEDYVDQIVFIYRDDYYFLDSEDRGIAEVIIAKSKNSPVRTIRLAWLAQSGVFAYMDIKKRV